MTDATFTTLLLKKLWLALTRRMLAAGFGPGWMQEQIISQRRYVRQREV